MLTGKRNVLFGWCCLLFLAIVGCGGPGPISAITPIALESAELSADSTPIALEAENGVDPLPLDAVATVNAADSSESADSGESDVVAVPTIQLGSGLVSPENEPTLEPIPVMERIPRGVALAQALSEDRAWQLEPNNPVALDEEPVTLHFDDFFDNYDPWATEAPTVSDKLLALDGKKVVIEGYMAPPLQLGLDWFMMTRQPLGFCPFHSSTASWTPDILLVYVDGPEIPFSWEPLRIEGELHVGGAVDPVSGMASLVRLYANDSDIETLTFSQ